MKKTLAIFLIVCLLFSGCSSNKAPVQETTETTIESLTEEEIAALPDIEDVEFDFDSYNIDYQEKLVDNIYLFTLQDYDIDDIFKSNDQIVITGTIWTLYLYGTFFINITEEQYKQIEDASTIKMAVKITDVVPVSTFYADAEHDETDDESVYAYIDVDQGDHIIKGYCIEVCN